MQKIRTLTTEISSINMLFNIKHLGGFHPLRMRHGGGSKPFLVPCLCRRLLLSDGLSPGEGALWPRVFNQGVN